MNERETFAAAMQKSSPEQRAAYLAEACGSDAAMRQRIQELIAEQERLGSFLESPATGVVPLAAETLGAEPAQGPGSQIGPYKLLQVIGEGGMGVVYMAEQQQPVLRRVALKIIKPGMDTRQVIARFEAERQALALMDHPNIAKVLDAGAIGESSRHTPCAVADDGTRSVPTTMGRPFFVMELVKGVPITQYCDQQHLTPRERLQLFLPVCQAIQHAHQKGIIHRDLKPSNVLIALYDGRPVAKVIDFGVAKATNQRLTEKTMFTEVGSIIGTLEYMAPEQAELNNLDIDTRADIYSLGVLLYELLTGSPPFSARQLRSKAFDEMLRVIREEEPPRPSTRLSSSSELPSIAANRGTAPQKLSGLMRGELDWIVMKALEKDRGRRYESARDVADDLERYLHDEPVQACPPSAAYQLRKFVRRNQGPVVVAVLLLLSLLVGIVGTSLGLWRAELARRGEVLQRQIADRRRAEAQAQTTRAVGAERLATQRLAQTEAEKNRADREAKAARTAQWEAQRLAASLALDHALQQCERGEVAIGLHELARALSLAPDAADLNAVIRLNLADWSKQLCTLQAVLPHGEWPIEALAVAPDDATIWTVGYDIAGAHYLWRWDRYTGKLIDRESLLLFGGPRLAISPDGRYLFAGGENRKEFGGGSCKAQLWDRAAGKVVQPSFLHRDSILHGAFSPDGRSILLGSDDNKAQLWDLSTEQPIGAPVDSVAYGHSTRLAFRPDGKAFATITDQNSLTAGTWEAETGKPLDLARVLREGGGISSLALSPDGKSLATGHVNIGALLWNGAQELHHLPQPPSVSAVAFSPDGRLVLTGCGDGQARLWDVASGQLLATRLQHPSWISNVAFSLDGKTVVTAGTDVRLWKSMGPFAKKVDPDEYYWVDFTPDGEDLILIGFITAKVLNLATGQPRKTLYAPGRFYWPYPQARTALFATPIAALNDLRIVDLLTGENLGEPMERCNTIRFDPVAKVYYTHTWDRCFVRDAATGQPIGKPILPGSIGSINGFAVSPDRRVAVISFAGNLRLWDLASGTARPAIVPQTPPVLRELQYTPDGRAILASDSQKAVILDPATLQPRGVSIPVHPYYFRLAFDPQRGWVLIAGSDHTVRIWDYTTGQPVGPPMQHQGTIHAVAFSPDCRFVVTGSEDGTARFWDPVTGKPLGRPLRHDGPVSALAFSPDGKQVATIGPKSGVQLWPVPEPLAGDVTQIRLWTEVITGLDLDDHGVARTLNAKTWTECRDQCTLSVK